ncbi:DUF3048 domain-containing protein [Candidatus Gottesmanbacteria bacterium]|nr:DUF3048 domain-containing protein [Candidatus Gottesmanbacteria bacterium]
MNKNQLITQAFVGLALYLIATGVSFAGFTFVVNKLPAKLVPSLTSQIPKNGTGGFNIDPSIPRTEACPINGVLYTKGEKETWDKRRPLAVMIENHAEARPQSGLSYADVVYEAVAEGGVSRFMGIFYCGIAGGNVSLAPVRSARMYFLPWVLEYDALYNHVGGAGRCSDDTVDDRAKALCQIEQFKIKDMDQFGISFPTCYRNYDRLPHPVATEHTMVCVTDKLYKLAAERGWTNVDAKGVAWDKNFQSWKFKDDAKEADRGASFSANFTAWKGWEKDYGVRWDYDPATNSYKRTNGGAPHTDLENGKQLMAKAVIIIFAKETGPVDEHAHLLYTTYGVTGDALVFQDGKVTKGTWQKPLRSSRTKILDDKGKEVAFNKGQIWFELLPIGTPVAY